MDVQVTLLMYRQQWKQVAEHGGSGLHRNMDVIFFEPGGFICMQYGYG